ncbi:ABC transporter substrate-binding protein [Moellerella wisconsensis]|uniref:ABC transporter substrate-binding protein n=2 Tax=Moellerella wisconsensis TaxID=158849 RepID=A0A9Q8Q3I0_9GAMM|nr:ABC transporter substrate-binding protein [Moellerella wisconsensis]KLN95795.1 ABC transporter substrate-binding protein [Moellerella wisconsensis]UNH25179.1 ABC transporter substrate-binding protein [Moellerella wisconsensis]UNH31785.1 ABC transporter substrate-binding protein [Moellerella wisconsensis]UNH39846.1 ABC transporter substrate-binding protein [Moellerella wisconsensis]UNH43457.1 ABC transporter substrate-binding protein [Moellerella wisconsensis]
MKIKYHLLSASLLASLAFSATATTYPVTFTDTDGQEITLKQEPKRIVLQDGRDILALALLDRDNPFERVVAWNNNLKKSDPQAVSLLESQWKSTMNNIPDMGFNDKGEVNTELVIAQRPDVLIAQLRAKPALEGSGVVSKLKQANIPIIYVDTFLEPVKNTKASVSLLGLVLNKEQQAKQYTDFYQQHLDNIQIKTAKVVIKPRVFVEAKAGANGSDSCCFTHNNAGWGGMIQAVGADNIGSHYLPGSSGTVSLEQVISTKPDVYIVTGSRWVNKKNIAVPFGYGVTTQETAAGFERLKNRVGFNQISAVADNQLYGVYHNFYNHTYNIVGLEYLAKFIYPNQFSDLNPSETYNTIIKEFTTIPVAEAIWGIKSVN